MNSSIFRRNTRKSLCGCSRGGAMTELQQQEKNLAGLNKQLVNANRLALSYKVRQDLTRRRNEKKARVNALKAAKANTGILSAITNKVQNAVQAVQSNATKVNNAVITANKTVQNSAAPQAVVAAEAAANNAVVAANAAVNKSKNLVALANRAQALANNIRKTVGGKRRTHCKSRKTHRK